MSPFDRLRLIFQSISTFHLPLSAGLPQESASRREGPLPREVRGPPWVAPRDPRLWFLVREFAGLAALHGERRAARIKEQSVVSHAAGCLIYWEGRGTVCSRGRARIGGYENRMDGRGIKYTMLMHNRNFLKKYQNIKYKCKCNINTKLLRKEATFTEWILCIQCLWMRELYTTWFYCVSHLKSIITLTFW